MGLYLGLMVESAPLVVVLKLLLLPRRLAHLQKTESFVVVLHFDGIRSGLG